MRVYFFCLVIPMVLSLFGCSLLGHRSPRYVKIADKITEKTAKQLEVKRHLHLIGTGGRMMDDIKEMDMSFCCYQEVNIQKGREIILEVINDYLYEINNNSEIKPYLNKYPFTAKNLEIRIWFYKHDRSSVSVGNVCYISAIDGVLKYYAETDPYHVILAETYEEAVERLGEHQDLTLGLQCASF